MKRIPLDVPAFAPVPLSREQVLATAQACVGLPYSDKSTFVEWDEDGKPHGQCNCYGLPFVVAARLGLIDARAFWSKFNRAVAKHGTPQTLRSYLGAQLWRERKTNRQPGDILLFRWHEEQTFANEDERIKRGRHHVAFDAGEGWIIHAVDTTADGQGSVFKSFLNARDWEQLHQVWALPQYALIEAKESENDG